MTADSSSVLTPEIRGLICRDISEGMSLKEICAVYDISRTTVHRLVNADEEFATAYQVAKDVAADLFFDELQRIADQTQLGETVTTRFDGSEEVQSGDMLGHRKLRIDTLKWRLSKMAPKKYGDKLDIDASVDGKLIVEIVKFGVDDVNA